MATRRLIPLLDRVLVEKITAPTKSAGGVLLPESALPKVGPMGDTRKCRRTALWSYVRWSHIPELVRMCPQVNEGVVLAVGPGRRNQAGDLIPTGVKEGDKVLLPEYGGSLVKLDQKE